MPDFIGQTYSQADFTEKPPALGLYEQCHFSGCRLQDTDLSGFIFEDCIFEHCDLSMAKLKDTAFRRVVFRSCKMLGMAWNECHRFGTDFSFEDCQLHFALFSGMKLKKVCFTRCSFASADFTGADLQQAVMNGCDLTGAVFFHTNLQEADLSTAYGFSIHPAENTIRKARFSAQNLHGLLQGYGIKIV